jgi:hypothetical protein
MITNLIDFLFGNTIKKIAAIGIALGLLFGGCQIRSCIKAKEELWQYKAAEKIRQKDRKIDQQIEDKKHEVENYSNLDDLEHGFEELRGYGE